MIHLILMRIRIRILGPLCEKMDPDLNPDPGYFFKISRKPKSCGSNGSGSYSLIKAQMSYWKSDLNGHWIEFLIDLSLN